ncbi:hypothetical protein BH11MYX3_BH11MYX3_20630 [soil metagenome]
MRPDMPPALEQVILVALAKSPDQRFTSAQAMSVALQHATQQLPQEQWAPLTLQPRTSGGLPTPSWPSQPPSWAAPRGAHESVQPPLAHQTTVSAGQVTSKARGTRPGSKKGVWIVLFAVLLVGGGITAAVVAGSSSEDAASTETVAASPTTTEATTPLPPAPNPAAPTPVAAPTTAVAPTPKPAAPTSTRTGDATPRTVTPPATTPVPAVEADDDSEPKAPADWFERHSVTPPGRDMKKVDVDKHIAWAIAEAKKVVPDAQLFRIDLENVFPDGHADLTLPGFAYKYGGIDLRFISPSHTKRDPSVPRGVKIERICELRVDGGPDGFEIRDLSGDCDDIPVPPPKCKLAQVWTKALAKHPDVADAVASIDYRVQGKRPMWWFTIYDNGKSIVSETYPDDCP